MGIVLAELMPIVDACTANRCSLSVKLTAWHLIQPSLSKASEHGDPLACEFCNDIEKFEG